MEARFCRVVFVTTLLVYACGLGFSPAATNAAGYKTVNFTVNAPSSALAKEIGDAAEMWRKHLANEWLGQELPNWSQPCPISVRLATGAGGQTSFTFDGGQVFGWNMSIQGSRERMLDSVLPHEITHTVFASHFRKPLPRWADEGACTTVEHSSEVAKQERMLIDFLKTKRGISFSQMFAMTEYPRDVMPLYSQGHSVSQWLIESRGRRAFLAFLNDGMSDDHWPRAVERHYGFANLGTMQEAWLEWVKSGRPRISPESSLITQQLARRDGVVMASAAANEPAPQPVAAAIYRGQSPDSVTPIAAAPIVSAPIAAAPMNVAPSDPAAKVPTSTTVAVGGSVYAASAARAEQARAETGAIGTAAPARTGASIYDATRELGVIRR